MAKPVVDHQEAEDFKKDLKTLIIDDQDGYNELVAYVDTIKPSCLALGPRVDAEALINEETHHKRALYSEMELIRLDFNNIPIIVKLETILTRSTQMKGPIGKELSTLVKNTLVYKKAFEIYDILDPYRLKLAIPPVKTSQFRKLLNIIMFATFLFVSLNVCLLTTPLRVLDPLLVKYCKFRPNQLPSDYLQHWFSRSSLFWGGIETYWENIERIDSKQPYVMMYTHQCSYDAWLVASSPISLRLMGKPSLFYIPLLGWLAYLWDHIPISRTNLASSKKAIEKAAAMLKRTGRSTAISPEGTRSKTGRIIDFKKGPFHLALQANLPICPIIVLNASELWPGSDILNAPGRVTMRCVEPINIKPGETYQELRYRTKKIFLEEYAKPICKNITYIGNDLISFISLPICAVICYYEFSFFKNFFGF